MFRRSSSALAVVLAMAFGPVPGRASAQSFSADTASFTSEWVVISGLGQSIGAGSRAGREQAFQAIEWGRLVTGEHGPGVLRGRLELAIELTPVFMAFQSNRVEGAGVSPAMFRWNLREHGPFHPFLELAGGVVATDREVPEGTTRWNFTAHAGAGARVRVAPRWAVMVGYRYHHLSNGNSVARNPGINSNVGYLGLAYRR
jgi:lipid A 3-O-deacylase